MGAPSSAAVWTRWYRYALCQTCQNHSQQIIKSKSLNWENESETVEKQDYNVIRSDSVLALSTETPTLPKTNAQLAYLFNHGQDHGLPLLELQKIHGAQGQVPLEAR
jgi:hypothetical protein